MKKLKPIISLFLVCCMLFNYIPIADIIAYAADPAVVEEIKVVKTYDRDRKIVNADIQILGDKLKDKKIYVESTAEPGVLVDMDSIMSKQINEEDIVRYRTDKPGTIVIQSIRLDGKTYTLSEGDMPVVTGSPRRVSVGQDITVNGNGLNKFITDPTKFKLEIPGTSNTGIASPDGSTATISGITGALGLKTIGFAKSETVTVAGAPVKQSISHNYKDQFSLTSPLVISNDLKMTPLSGKKGSTVFFEASNMANYDIFFLKDPNDFFEKSNKATAITFNPVTKILQAQVPFVTPGSYYVYLTNKTTSDSPTDEITQLKLITKADGVTAQKFQVVEAGNEMIISYIDPNKGSDIGEAATIVGQSIGTLNVPGLSLTAPTYTTTTGSTMKVTYGAGTYDGQPITKVEKSVKVTVGDVATIQSGLFEQNIDKLNVRMPSITIEEELKADVVIETETIIYDGATEVARFPEKTILSKGYTFVPSKIRPKDIKSIAPPFIQVVNTPSGYETYKKLTIGIQGENFLINSYKSGGQTITHYPVVQIGSIVIDKNKGQITSNGQTTSMSGLNFWVLDANNQILDGTEGHELGTRIVFELPAAIRVQEIGKQPITITNPIRNAEGNGHALTALNLLEFVVVNSGVPKILEVNPYTVITEGGDDVKIIGADFQPDVKVFIDGKEVENIKREGEDLITFKAPPGRQGITQLQVMNPNGGIDTHVFIYVKTYTDPKMFSLIPNWGMMGTLVKITGENFLRPSPTGSDKDQMDMNKLIGTRVLIENKESGGYKDYNVYNIDGSTGNIKLENFKSRTDNLLLSVEKGRVKLADYSHSLVLKDTINDDFYTLSQKIDGTVLLSDGGEYTYTLSTSGTAIQAIDLNNINYGITVTEGGLSIVNIDSTIKATLKFQTPYHMTGDAANGYVIDGNIITSIEKDQIYFKVPALPVVGQYRVKIENPDTKRAPDGEGLIFNYKKPTSKPTLTTIDPNRGSTTGGYYVTLTGTKFEDDSLGKTHVFFGGVEVDKANIIVSTDGTTMKVKVPEYKGEILYEATVPVVVINNDGGSAFLEKGFTYVKSSSQPIITELRDDTGDTVGGEEVVILGKHFVYWEPFVDKNGDLIYQVGEPFTDLNGNGVHDDYRKVGSFRNIPAGSSTEAAIRAVLPKVFVGENEAKVTEWSDGRITILTPPGKKGKVDVVVINNDFGTSNKLPYTYTSKPPKITNLIPTRGTREGGTQLMVEGENFKASQIYMMGATTPTSLALIRFGDEAKNTNLKDNKSGRIVNGLGTVDLKPTGMIVNYDATDDANHKLKINLKQTIAGVTKEYSVSFENYGDDIRYFNTTQMIDIADGTSHYPYQELVKIWIDPVDKRLVIERGYAPEAVAEANGVRLRTPQHYIVGPVDVLAINPDGEKGLSPVKFTYTNPLMDMKMTDIIDTSPEKTLVSEAGIKPHYVIEATTKIELKFSIIGQGFTQDSEIKIGGIKVDVPKEKITATRIDVTLDPKGKNFKMNENLVITVENQDNAVASWDNTMKDGRAVFIKFIETDEPQPQIDEISPKSGSILGNYQMKIIGKNFAVKNDLTNTLVKIDGKETPVLAYRILADGRMELTVIVPQGTNPGKVDVYVRNKVPLGESVLKEGFTYISSPRIKNINPDEFYTTGGQTVTISGVGFMDGAKVYVRGTLVSGAKFIDSKTIEFTSPAGDLGPAEVKVENPDGGTMTVQVTYILPVPGTPLRFTATPGSERSVILEWNKSNLTNKYKIFAKEGKYSANMSDYEFIAETEGLEYVVRDLQPGTMYTFILFGINEYGESKTSAYATTTTLTSAEDKNDDKYDDDSIKHILEINAGEHSALINLPATYYPIKYEVDLNKAEYGNIEHIIINIPVAAFSYDYGKMTFKNKDVQASFTLAHLKSALDRLNVDRRSSDANVRIEIHRLDKTENYQITKKLAKGEKALSPSYSIALSYQEGRKAQNLTLVQPIQFGFNLPKASRNYKKTYLRQLDPASMKLNKLRTLIDTGKSQDYVYSEILGGGAFVVVE